MGQGTPEISYLHRQFQQHERELNRNEKMMLMLMMMIRNSARFCLRTVFQWQSLLKYSNDSQQLEQKQWSYKGKDEKWR